MTLAAQRSSRFSRAASVLVASLLVFLLANAVCWALNAWLDARRDRVNPVQRKYGLDLTAYYPGMTAAEIDELLRVSWSLPPRYAPFVGRKLAPVTSRYVNVSAQGFRVGKDQKSWPPDRERHRVIFFFGGSTAFGMGLPDADASPSRLQEALAMHGGREPAVYNLAVPANTSTSERVQFEQLLAAGLVPDVAVFLDGLNDRAPSHDPLGTPEVAQILDTGAYQKPSRLFLRALVQLPLARTLSRALHAGGLLRSPDSKVEMPDDDFAALVIRRYRANQQMIAAVAASFGVQPVFVWQPVPDYAYPQDLHAFDDLGREELRPKRRVYEEMRRLLEAGELGPDFVWCADLGWDAARPQYVDAVHYGAEMSRAVASCIASKLLPAP